MSAADLGVVSIVDAVTADLRTRILSGTLAAGQPLGEVDTAAHYGVARPTVRAAIEALVAAGLLTRGAHKSARVAELGPADAADIYSTRERIEAEVVRELARRRASAPESERANALLTDLTDADPLTIVDVDMRFHSALVDAVGSPRTSRVYRMLADEVRLCMTRTQSADLLTVADITREHNQILSAITDGDADRAAALLRGHLQRARERLVAHLEHTA
ncbi:GntR family transcriptional regulator [Microbacterium sp. ZW T5_56]|uniref:GntR family transcriptional regulator n=1 Tax=Microbacterium sp. ZW T5_56 TaxID=3378081 RepID=UPI00385228B9